MSPVLAALAASATTLAATNVDDIFLLTLVFARRVSTRRIVAGQYLGVAAIVTGSFAAAWAVGATSGARGGPLRPGRDHAWPDAFPTLVQTSRQTTTRHR